ncbi:flagellar hook-basal body complex protein FliE [Rhodovibrio salinarum]|uniref:Flagellar hook-basal body complex protein FliE n=1 Tax=Rhodovibrio salinarum TaxID=1087 RepID=A0A934V0X7_9PROT|nr:flagellar hook-basal body complex protein FliE [Rhodovibrio salinarum]MBK1698413.1 flagellar hook-basal body complex protein FliE [Rhodovibrio salinarum]
MSVSYSEALAAYKRVAEQAKVQPSKSEGTEAITSDFAQMLRSAGEDAIQDLKGGERMSLAAAAGKADINDVVMAMSQAERTLQTVVTLRDKAVQAYQQIMRMPI